MTERDAAKVAANGRSWWRNSAILIHVALPNSYFDHLGIPPIGRVTSNSSNRPVRTRMPGGVAGVPSEIIRGPYAGFVPLRARRRSLRGVRWALLSAAGDNSPDTAHDPPKVRNKSLARRRRGSATLTACVRECRRSLCKARQGGVGFAQRGSRSERKTPS